MSSEADHHPPRSEKPFNFDITKTSKFNSNVWVLCVLIIGALMGYGMLRDLQESDRLAFKEIVQMQKDAAASKLQLFESYQRQEKHFEFADARLDQLERKSAATERTMDVIKNNVEWLVNDRRQNR